VRRFLIGLVVLASLVLAPSQVLATSVDLELLLLVDVSGSIDSSEFALQRTGYVNAFNNPSLVTAIQNGSIGSIAVSLVYWSGTGQQQQAVSWTLINDATSATAFATAVGNAARPYAGGNTALGEALQVGGALFPNNSFEGTRDVIDVSGDGATNTGISSSTGRASALAAGVDTINGLVILGESGLLAHYQTEVIGGVDPFVIAVSSFDDFGHAIEDKLIGEINGAVPEPLTIVAVACGLGGLGRYIRRRRLVAVQAAA